MNDTEPGTKCAGTERTGHALRQRAFQKQIKAHLTALGYIPHKNRLDYHIDCADGETRLIVRVPDGIHGVFIGAQFTDFGDRSGNFVKAPAHFR